MTLFQQNPYPINSFPDALKRAIREALRIVQTTDVIAATSVLNALSCAIGGSADWKHPATGQVRPCTLYQCVVAPSGERKTTTDALMCKPVYDYDEASILRHAAEMKAYQVAQVSWQSTIKGLQSRRAKLLGSGKCAEMAELELATQLELKPEKPVLHRMIRQDITHRAVVEALEGDGKAIALMTDEGQVLLGSNVMEHLGALNGYWDGKRISPHDRGHNEFMVILNPRATVNIMVQPAVLNKFMSKHGDVAHGSGHWARYLFARSPSIQGYRLQTYGEQQLVDLVPFHARLTELLEDYQAMVKVGKITRDVLEFDDEAKRLWFHIAANVERDIKPGSYLSDVGDSASKYMDLVSRIATLLWYYQADTRQRFGEAPEDRVNRIGKIPADILASAEEIAAWSLHEYKQIFAPAGLRTPEQLDADRVYSYLYRSYFSRNVFEVAKNHIRQYCGVRGGRYYRAIGELIQWGAIRIMRGAGNTEIIEFNRNYFGSYPV